MINNLKLFKMKTCSTLLLFFVLPIMAQAQVGIGTTDPNPSSILDVTSSDKGFLPPRVALVEASSSAPLLSHVEGMVVYNTITQHDVVPGLYVNNGTKWLKLAPEKAYLCKSFNGNITLNSTTNYTEILRIEDFAPMNNQVRISVNMGGRGFVDSVQALEVEVLVFDQYGVLVSYFDLYNDAQEKSDVATSVVWNIGIANHVLEIENFVFGLEYDVVLQAKTITGQTPSVKIWTSLPGNFTSLCIEDL